MKDPIDSIVVFIVLLIAFAITIFASKWVFETVMASDLPNWLKFMILR